ncbi:MAG TPA: His/Gly/Thr/Pro-type tRNA ligase C-terminal domain-containing protein [Candidatus Paceibacterota bacterium]
MQFISPLLTDSFPKKASSVASYYGFIPLSELLRRYGMQKRVRVALDAHTRRDPFIGDTHALMTACAERGAIKKDVPLFLYHINSDCGDNTFCEHHRKAIRFSLFAFGIDKSIAEAMVLHATTAILQEAGVPTYRVYVNSIGDRDSTAKYVREAQNYLRKHLNDMPVSLQTAFRRDLFQALDSIIVKGHPLRDALPRPMQFLTDASRRHLREVLEYLESTEIPYAIDDFLIGHKDYYSQTIFEMRLPNPHETEEEVVVARGGHFDDITRRFFRSAIPGAGIVIEGGTPRRLPNLKVPAKRPKVCLINIGLGAKRQSLPLIEMLRTSRIPLHQSLGSDHLGDQLAFATSIGVPYALIIGQREALDGTVIVRDMNNQSQQTVHLVTLPMHLRKMRL